jgi:antitoxin component YwqK of YwqJK toxin-antitoxin module
VLSSYYFLKNGQQVRLCIYTEQDTIVEFNSANGEETTIERRSSKCTEYYKNGQLKKDYSFVKGSKSGEWIYYDTEGNIELVENYLNDSLISIKK